MKRVLIVGANSYIGKSFENYVNQINDNRNVYQQINDRISRSKDLKKDNSDMNDINDLTAIHIDKVSASNGDWKAIDYSNYDSILMLSAIVHRKEKCGMELLYHQVNCELPVEIAIKAKAAGAKQFIFMSTAAVYGSKVVRITKDTLPEPDTFYGKTKFEAEELLKTIAVNSKDKRSINMLKDWNENVLEYTQEFCLAIIRPPMVYGEGCRGNYIRLQKLARFLPLFPNIHNKRSILHVDTLCENIYTIIMKSEAGIYLPQDEEYADTAMVVKKMRLGMGKRTLYIKGFNWLIRIITKHVGAVRKLFGDFYYERDS